MTFGGEAERVLKVERLRVQWRSYESRLERVMVGVGMSLVAVLAEVLISRRLRR